MKIRLHNSASRTIEEFVPINQGHIKMYVCGPTVYGPVHLGNARPIVVFDILYRLLVNLYPKVSYVRNITDVDDKIIAAAEKAKVSAAQWATECTEKFHQTIANLNVLAPTKEPKATEYIVAMIEMIETLIEKGNAYEASGHVLFNVASYSKYGTLANRTLDQMRAGSRVEVASYKKNPEDFVLWKPAGDIKPSWDSPWGSGRPGWHLECSAMINKCLEGPIDIHGGGNDLLFPHHENESAQSCCYSGDSKLANYWIHNGQVIVSGRKMAKSENNFSTVEEALRKQPAEALRYALLSSHYRSPLDWSFELLSEATATVSRLYRALERVGNLSGSTKPAEEVVTALASDLNTPLALTHLHELASKINRCQDSDELILLGNKLVASGNLIGLLTEQPAKWLRGDHVSLSEAELNELLAKRNQARASRDFIEADRLRDQLTSAGFTIEDGPTGSSLRRQ